MNKFFRAAFVVLAVSLALATPAFALTTVTNTNDSGAGSLRQALLDEPANGTINFAANVTGTITLNSTLSLANPVTISGPGASVLAISGGSARRIFDVPVAAVGGTYTIRNLTLRNGRADYGGAFREVATAPCTFAFADCEFRGNHATSLGGGIYSPGNTTTVTNCRFVSNSSNFLGGGLYATANLTVANSVFENNSALYGGAALVEGSASGSITTSTFTGNTVSTSGGAILIATGPAFAISQCAFISNSASGDGGALALFGPPLTITNCTFYGNYATSTGGAIYKSGNTTTLRHCTVYGNTAITSGGIANTNGTFNVANSIIAGNTSTANESNDMGGAFVTQSGNIIGDGQGSSGITNNVNEDRVGTNQSPLDPKLGPLIANTARPYLPLLPGSIALNNGFAGTNTDQRGLTRPQLGNVDAGAIEHQPPSLSMNSAALAFTENTPVAIDAAMSFSGDVTNPPLASVQISANYVAAEDRLLFTDQSGITGSFDTATGTLNLSGVTADFQTVLRAVQYTNLSDNPTTTTRTVTVRFADGFGSFRIASRDLTITAVNDAPVNTVPGTQLSDENNPLTFSSANGNGIAITDPDAVNLRLTLSVSAGTLALATLNNLGFTSGGNNAATMTFSGPIADVNAALDGMQFSPPSGFRGFVTVTVTSSDLGGTGSGGARSDTDFVLIEVRDHGDIAITRNGASIANGTTDAMAGTFPVGSPLRVAYGLANVGHGTLALTGAPAVQITGTTNCTATVTTTPATSIAAGSSTGFAIEITATSAGAVSITFTIANTDSNENPTTITATGTAANAPEISLWRNGVAVVPGVADDLGACGFGTNFTVTYEIRNSGAAALSLPSAPTISGPSNATVSATAPPTSIAVNDAGTFTVSIAAGMVGEFWATLSLPTNDPDDSPFIFTVHGHAVPVGGPEIAVWRLPAMPIESAVADDVGDMLVSAATSYVWTIRNAGDAELAIGSVAVTEQRNALISVAQAPVSVLLPGEITAMEILVQPAAEGTVGFTIEIATNDADESRFVLGMVGRALATAGPEIQLYRLDGRTVGTAIANAGTDALGPLTVGETVVRMYLIENRGSGPLNITTQPLVTAATNAAVSVTTVPSTIPANGGTAELLVAFTPLAAGAVGFTVSFTTNDADESAASFSGQSAGQEPRLAIMRSPFSPMANGSTDATGQHLADPQWSAFVYTLKNTGNAPLTISAITVDEQVNCATALTLPATFTVAAGAETTLTLAVLHMDIGDFSCRLSVASNDPNVPTASVKLVGTAVDSGARNPAGCAMNGGSAAGHALGWLLAFGVWLAIAGIRRRVGAMSGR